MNFLPSSTVAYSKGSLQLSGQKSWSREFAGAGKDLSIQAFPVNPTRFEELGFRKIMGIISDI